MSVNSFRVINYKSFSTPTNVDLRPLTLVFGYNSSGKSALVRALPFLREAVLSAGSSPLPASSEAIRGATFADIKNHQSDYPVVAFSLGFDDEFSEYTFYIRDLPDKKTQVIEKFSVLSSDGSPLLTGEWNPGEGPTGNIHSYVCQIKVEGQFRTETVTLRFDGVVPRIAGVFSYDTLIIPALNRLGVLLRKMAANVYWLKALRCTPPRREIFETVPERMNPDGSGATQLLAFDENQGGLVLSEVVDWYRHATDSEFAIRRGVFLGTELISSTLISQGDPNGVALADTGEGISQVLPVLTLLGMAKHRKLGISPIISIEHPELHLHPSAHPELASFFCEAANIATPPRIIVETHSENFLLAIQLAIIQGRLPAERLCVYWVRPGQNGTLASQILFDELGRPLGDNWPPGLFNESSIQSRQIVVARTKKER